MARQPGTRQRPPSRIQTRSRTFFGIVSVGSGRRVPAFAAATMSASRTISASHSASSRSVVVSSTRRPLPSSSTREQLSPRHVPDRILAVPEIPRTLNGKKLEVPVKRLLTGEAVERAVSLGAVANPGALAPFLELASRR